MDPPATFRLAKLLLVTSLLFTCLCPTVWAVNVSDFPGDHSGSRLAYYRWREWLLSRAAVLQQVPPAPRMSAAGSGMQVKVTFDPVGIIHTDEAQQTVKMSARVVVHVDRPGSGFRRGPHRGLHGRQFQPPASLPVRSQ